jgi:hypothetical protein
MKQVLLKWRPLEDITTYELALCIPTLLLGEEHVHMDVIYFDQRVLRNFKVIDL